MFDIGLGEILLLAVVGLLVFGPEKLPKAAADAGRLIRSLREMATGARRDLAESAGLDLSDAQSTLKDIADLHPRRIMAGLVDDVSGAGGTPGAAPAAGAPSAGVRGGGATGSGGAAAGGSGGTGAGAARPGDAPAAFDPDAT